MSALVVLVRYSLRKLRGPLIALWILLFALQILMTMIARTFEASGQFSEMARFIPEFIRPLLDPSFMAALSFSGMVCFGYSHVIVILLLVAQSIAGASELTDEMESKFIDLLASRPLPRSMLVIRSMSVVLLSTLSSVAVLVVGTLTGLRFLAPKGVEGPPMSVVLSLGTNLSLLALAWGGIAIAISVLTTRRTIAVSAVGLLAFAMFVVDFAGRLWEPIDKLAAISPFRYYVPFRLIAGEPAVPGHLAILGGVFVLGSAIGLLKYRSRDL